MLHPTRHLRDGDLPADLHPAASPDLLRSTIAAAGEHTEVRPARDMATVRVATCAGLVTGRPSATAGSRAAQR